MDSTPRLALPYLLPKQVQKHVTVNEPLKALDVMTGLSMRSRTFAAQPASPCPIRRVESGRFFLRTQGGQLQPDDQFSSGTLFTTQTGELAGTTGDDGKANFSVIKDGRVIVENRRVNGVANKLYVLLR